MRVRYRSAASQVRHRSAVYDGFRVPATIDLTECSKDPWKDWVAVKTWFKRPILSLVRRLDASREDVDNYVLSKRMHTDLRAHVTAPNWLFPTGFIRTRALQNRSLAATRHRRHVERVLRVQPCM